MSKRLSSLGLCLAALLITGCGNQMYRQPSFNPLQTPRTAPPADSVPVSAALTPPDGRPVASPAYGAAEAAPVLHTLAAFPAREPDLPPPNLSDNARYEHAPAVVDALKNPLPNDPRLVQSGHILFLNRCVQCHNAGGYGYGKVGQYLVPHPPDLAAPLVQHITDGAIFWHITMGQGKMPGFRHWTTPAERWGLVKYVRSLKNAPKPPANVEQESTALSETPGTPYPVYGLSGFERGHSAYPFKSLHPHAYDDATRGLVFNAGSGQPPPSH